MILIQFSTVSYIKTNTLQSSIFIPFALTFSASYHIQKFKGAFYRYLDLTKIHITILCYGFLKPREKIIYCAYSIEHKLKRYYWVTGCDSGKEKYLSSHIFMETHITYPLNFRADLKEKIRTNFDSLLSIF